MKHRWVYRLYNLLVLCSLPLIFAGVFFRWRRRLAGGLERWSERWGHLLARPDPGRRVWWVHAVSLGEVKAIEVFLRQAPRQAKVQIVLSLVTPEALRWATEKNLAEHIVAAPIDLPWVVRRAFGVMKPELFVSVESEFWPNLLREAKRAGARVALINGRISAHSYRSYLRIRWILSALWENFDTLAVRQHEDASRFIGLGVSPSKVHVTGNLKYDLPLPARHPGRRLDQEVLTIVVGSSREGEERVLLPVLRMLHLRLSRLRIIWAPRHLSRVGEVVSLLTEEKLPCTKKSEGAVPPVGNILWDTMGDLLDAYEMADLAIVGGSFVPKGGQNPIEPAALSLPVIFGPSMENFHGIAEVLVQQGGARQVTLAELEPCLKELLESQDKRRQMGERARQAVLSRQGATERTLALLEELRHA